LLFFFVCRRGEDGFQLQSGSSTFQISHCD
jgi:hypothetical protein